MGVLADHQIIGRQRLTEHDPLHPELGDLGDMALKIKPFARESPKGAISYGVSSYGYDVRVGYHFKVFTPVHCGIIDPKNFDPRCFVDVDLTQNGPHSLVFSDTAECYVCKNCGLTIDENGPSKQLIDPPCPKGKPDHILIPPNSFVLAETMEYLEISRDCVCIVLGKSTYARCGIIVNVTPLEPSWTGTITMEISNTSPLPAKVYTGEGIAQILFLKGDSMCATSYADKKGIYQSQNGIVLPRVK